MQTTGDVDLVHILSRGNGILVAEQLPSNIFFPASFITLICIFVVGYLLWTRRWILILIPVLIVGIAWWVKSSGTTYQMTANGSAGAIAWRASRGNKETESSFVEVRDIAAADIMYGKSGGRLVLVRKSGGEVFPLGSSYVANEPAQLIIVQEIRKLIGGQGSETE